MSASEYEPNAQAGGSEAERRARQLAQLVEAERRRRRRTLRLYLSLLAVPVALALFMLLRAPVANTFSLPPAAIEPLVQEQVGRQLPTAVEQRLGDQIDTAIEAKVGEKVQGASPAKVRELSEGVEQVKRELTQVQAGVEGIQELKASLPQIRSQLDAQAGNVREIQQRITRLPNGGDAPLAVEFKQLQGRLGELEQKLDRSVTTLAKKMDENSQQINALAVKLSAPGRRALPQVKGAVPPRK